MISPVSTSSLARPKPTSLTSREQPPTPGIRPRLFSGSPQRAERAAPLTSQPMASSAPPPREAQLIAAPAGLSAGGLLVPEGAPEPDACAPAGPVGALWRT